MAYNCSHLSLERQIPRGDATLSQQRRRPEEEEEVVNISLDNSIPFQLFTYLALFYIACSGPNIARATSNCHPQNIHNTTTAAPNQFQPCPFVLLVPRLIYPTHSLKAVIPPASSTLQTVAPNNAPRLKTATTNLHNTTTAAPNQFQPGPLCFWFPD